MAKDNKLQRKRASKISRTPRNLSPLKACKNVKTKRKRNKSGEKKEWEDVNCSVCMEFPHNAVLLLCSSYDKGCRPYMCATSRRYSNCLDQYKKAYTKIAQPQDSSESLSEPSDMFGGTREKTEASELLCPLCRGQVKGWTVVDPARKYFNAKKRSCMQEKCKFVGSYKELRKHVKAKHPLARPRAVDPVLEEKWKRLECDRERSDVISTIISSTPGAVVLGDYVLEPNHGGDFDSDLDSDIDDDMGVFDLRSFAGGDFRPRRSGLSGFFGAASGLGLRRTSMFPRRRWRLR